jgi:predicted CXXCH cytochrome family protein
VRIKLLAIVLLVLLGAILAYTLTEEPHSFTDEECYNCHYDPNGNPSNLKAPVTVLCGLCHSVIIKRSTHPFDVVPRMADIPPDLPFTNGKVTCNTCHDIHSSSTIVFGIKSYFLRRQVSDIKDFCIACHENNLERPGHKELFIVAHEASKYVITDPYEPIDPLTAECIGCHDGSIGPDADFVVGSGVWMHAGSGHPVGVDYREARMRGSDLRPVADLNPKIRFFGGRVGCSTCHDWFLDRNVKIVMDLDGSIICIECHYQK